MKIAITAGDINGIGPEVIRGALAGGYFSKAEFTVFGPGTALRRTLTGLKVTMVDCGPADLRQEYGTLSPPAGEAAVRAVKVAVEATLAGEFQALVTAPISKKAVHLAGYRWAGHTEMLKEWCGVDDAMMMFLAEELTIGLLTTHLPLADVPKMLTIDRCLKKIRIFHRELKTRLGVADPRIALCGLNPHAGEDGSFGREEVDILSPATQAARNEGIDIAGPLPADSLFARKQFSAIIAVYHDQALIPAKSAPGGSVNYTGGLPIVRTSPDHGAAFDIAGKGVADSSGMINAIRCAIRLAGGSLERSHNGQ